MNLSLSNASRMHLHHQTRLGVRVLLTTVLVANVLLANGWLDENLVEGALVAIMALRAAVWLLIRDFFFTDILNPPVDVLSKTLAMPRSCHLRVQERCQMWI